MLTDGLQSPKKTPIYRTHLESNAKMTDFCGWNMPIQYQKGIIAEVKAVRGSVGIFDVSHMGRIEFEGSGAEYFLGKILSANLKALNLGRSKYNFICNKDGGIIDDAMVYRVGDERFLLIVNAGNTHKDLKWIASQAMDGSDCNMAVLTDKTAMIAVQGPKAVAIVDEVTHGAASKIGRFRIANVSFDGCDATLARTGYTGEDGFEIIVPADQGSDLWLLLKNSGAIECGLGSRDVLRLEAGLPLHGNDISSSTNPFEAGFGRFVYTEAPDYVAGDALIQLLSTEPHRLLVGFKMIGRGIPRPGLKILSCSPEERNSSVIGNVTSGTYSPTVDCGIGMGYVDRKYSKVGNHIVIDVRGRLVAAEIVKLPFYKPF
tara:strand:- start:1731 stop:2852 length:1122 start_codon:yes stop_codon:yes gene_type:complete